MCMNGGRHKTGLLYYANLHLTQMPHPYFHCPSVVNVRVTFPDKGHWWVNWPHIPGLGSPLKISASQTRVFHPRVPDDLRPSRGSSFICKTCNARANCTLLSVRCRCPGMVCKCFMMTLLCAKRGY